MKQKIILESFLSPGDIVMLTAAVRDLYLAHNDKFTIDVRTSCGELWENNPYITRIDEEEDDVKRFRVDYPLIHAPNSQFGLHFVNGYRMHLEKLLNISIPPTNFCGDIHISDEEKSWYSQIEELGITDKFWIINSGGKSDFTAKWINPEKMQSVVDHFKGKITFVQIGSKEHFHPKLKGVVNLIGKTDLRQLVRLIYHSSGVICPVTAVLHLAAAIPMKLGPPLNRPVVCIAGGREANTWEAYPFHQFLHTNGALPCCDNGGCWKSRCTLIGDGDKKDEDVCFFPIETGKMYEFNNKLISFREAKCLNLITKSDIIRAIELYYSGGVLQYGSCIPNDIPDNAKDYISL